MSSRALHCCWGPMRLRTTGPDPPRASAIHSGPPARPPNVARNPRRASAGWTLLQRPPAGSLFLDHVSHFVRDLDAAGALLETLGFAVTPATVESGSRLQDLLREANAIGAAMDFTIAQFFTEAPSKSDRAEELNAMWNRYVGEPTLGPARAIGYLELEIRANLSSLATNHILSGDTAARASSGTPIDSGIQVTMGDTF